MSMEHTCSACGQRIRKLNPHRMDRAKVELLERIAKLNDRHGWVKVQRDGRLIPEAERTFSIQCDDVHALRLTWFGLLERKEMRSGLYRVTPCRYQFLQGRWKVPALIMCRDGVVVEASVEEVAVHEVKDVILDKRYWDTYAGRQLHT